MLDIKTLKDRCKKILEKMRSELGEDEVVEVGEVDSWSYDEADYFECNYSSWIDKKENV